MSGRGLGFALLALSLGSCATSEDSAKYARADEALRRDPAFVRAYNACVQSAGFAQDGILGNFGIRMDNYTPFFQCMERSGWVQSPRWHPAAIGRYERRP